MRVEVELRLSGAHARLLSSFTFNFRLNFMPTIFGLGKE